MTWSDDFRRKSRVPNEAEIAKRAQLVRELKERKHKTHLRPDELDEILEPVDCLRERLRKKKAK